MSWERGSIYHLTQKTYGFSDMYPLLLCYHWSFIYRKSWPIENPKWAERVEVLAIRRRKIRAFHICIHFYCAIIGVSFTEFKIIKAFQWIPLSIKIVTIPLLGNTTTWVTQSKSTGNWQGPGFGCLVCNATSQLTLQLHQERLQVCAVTGWPGSDRPEGTPAMDLGSRLFSDFYNEPKNWT